MWGILRGCISRPVCPVRLLSKYRIRRRRRFAPFLSVRRDGHERACDGPEGAGFAACCLSPSMFPTSNCLSQTDQLVCPSVFSFSRLSRRAAIRDSTRRFAATSASAQSLSMVDMPGRNICLRRRSSTQHRTRSSLEWAASACFASQDFIRRVRLHENIR